MATAARTTTASTVFVATEIGMLHQLRAANTETRFEPVNSRAECRYMKMITPEKLLRSLRDGTDEVDVAPGIADAARDSVRRMIEIGSPGRGGE
jgi:quinolinate synthase